MKRISIPEEQQISPQNLERAGPWLRVSRCIHTDTFQIPSTKKKNLKKKQNPKLKREYHTERITQNPE